MSERRPWTEADDANLRKFHAEGKTDAVIAYIIGRAKQSVWTRRVRLGLKTHPRKPGGFTYSHTPEARARIAENNRKRWQDPAYRARMREILIASRVRFQERIFRTPKDPQTKQYYLKLRYEYGPEKARQLLAQENTR